MKYTTTILSLSSTQLVNADHHITVDPVIAQGAGLHVDPDSLPEHPPAYDDKRYLQCPEPVCVKESNYCQVSVCGDATYEIELKDDELPCSGTDEHPGGKLCPKQGDTTRIDCRVEIMSYLKGEQCGTCVAPEDAMCVKLTTGAYGCVFPGNCNVVNQCTDAVVRSDNYQKDAQDVPVVAENGYPVCLEEYKKVVDTTDYKMLVQDDGSDVPSNCELAYDTDKTCKCQTPVPDIDNPDKIGVSVCGDATYLLDFHVKPCSGDSSADPAGTTCPKHNDTAILESCRDNVLSYLTGGKNGTCVAPEDATCVKLKTGAWGCVFPGNCNTLNQCVDVLPVTEHYQTNEDGSVKMGDNKFPLLTPEAYESGDVTGDTTQYAKLTQFTAVNEQSSDSPVMTRLAFTTMTFISIVALVSM